MLPVNQPRISIFIMPALPDPNLPVVTPTLPGHRLYGRRCIWLCATVVSLLSACANPLLRQARQDCDPQAYELFPLVLHSQRVTEPVVVQVPDGTQHCITESIRQGDRSAVVTRCVPNYTMQTRWMDRWVNVDLNAKERTIWHERCVQQLCIERAGNTACEPKPATPTLNVPLTPTPPADTPPSPGR